ncbi:hypothetical protein O3P69_008774, partial [Scylla paramamosain]
PPRPAKAALLRGAEEAQAQPQAPHALHHAAAAVAGEEVPGEAVPQHRRAGRVLRLAQPHRDAGQDLVPEQTRQGQAAQGGGDGAPHQATLLALRGGGGGGGGGSGCCGRRRGHAVSGRAAARPAPAAPPRAAVRVVPHGAAARRHRLAAHRPPVSVEPLVTL